MASSLVHVIATRNTIYTYNHSLIHRLSEVKFPVHLFPEVKDPGSSACSLQEVQYGIQPGTCSYNPVHNFSLIHRLLEVKFPVHLLPEVKDAGSLAGSLQELWYGIQPGTPVGVALGDLQCSIISRLQPNDSGTIYIALSEVRVSSTGSMLWHTAWYTCRVAFGDVQYSIILRL